MGKQIIKVSVWTCRSAWSLSNKVVTMIFAIFCVVSGLFARTNSVTEDSNGNTIKGKALRSADSTVLSNMKIYLGQMTCPLYGVGAGCAFSAVDSVNTDYLGNFETGYPERLFHNGAGFVEFCTRDSVKVGHYNGYVTTYYSVDDAYLNSKSDTSIVLYMLPFESTSVSKRTASKPLSFSRAIHGNTAIIKLGNWPANEKYSAKIVNTAGTLIAIPLISSDGILNWNTEKNARGIYLLKIETNSRFLNTPILIK